MRKEQVVGLVGALAILGGMWGLFQVLAPEAPVPGVEAASVAGPRSLALEVAGCRIAQVFVEAPADRVRTFVPEAFDLVLSDTGNAQLAFGGYACDEATVENATGALRSAWVAVVVEPPAYLAGAAGTIHAYAIESYADDDAYGAARRALGENATALDDLALTFQPTGTGLSATFPNGTHAARALVGVQAPDAAGDTRYRVYSAASGGTVYEDGLARATGASTFVPGTFNPAAGTPAGVILGDSATGFVYAAPALAIEGLTLAFVPAPAA